MGLRRLRAGVTIAAALLLAGCAVEPPNVAVPIPVSYRAAKGGPTPVLPEDWVRGFGSAELNRLVAGTLLDNIDLDAALARIQQAEAQSVVVSSALFPILSGSSDASRQRTSGLRSNAGLDRGGTASNTYQLGLNASYNLDLFGRNRFAALAAGGTARSVRFERDVLALSTVASVANTYFNVLSAQDRLRIARDNLAIATRLLEAVRGRLGVGTGTALDVAQQESVVASQRATIPPLEQQVQQNRNVLAVLLGRTPESVSIRGGSLDALRVPRVGPGLPAELLLRRPDIAVQEANLDSASASVTSARAAFFPSIQLTAGSGFQSLALKSLLGANGVFYSVAAGLTQPILDGYQLQGQLDFEKGRAAEFAATYRKAIIQAFSDVENALIAVQQTTERERLQTEAVAASRRALAITEQRLREGTIDLVTLFNVQTTLFGSQDLLAQVRLQRFQAIVSLYQALGGGWSQARGVPRRPVVVEGAAL